MTTTEAERAERLYTIRDAARRLSVSPSTIRLWVQQGRLHRLKLGKSVRIPPGEIERLLVWGLAPVPKRVGKGV